MHQIQIEPTYKTPAVVFDPQKGNFQIQGNSILVNVEEFYSPLLHWMDEFVEKAEVKKVHFIFDIEYANVASTKRFLFFLYKLILLKEQGVDIQVDWLYSKDDQYIFEIGQDLSQMLELPFNFKVYTK